MASKVWIDGKLVDKNDARVSVFDHGLLFGDGVWEGMRIYSGRVFKLREHLDRLRASAEAIRLSLPHSADELAAAVEATVSANNRTEGYVRLTVTRGPGTLGLDPRKCEPMVIVIAEDVVPYPREVYDAGLEVSTFFTVHSHTLSTPGPQVKGLSYLHRVLATAHALGSGCLDAILLDHTVSAVGTTDGNLFVVRGGGLRTHPVQAGAFPGITRGVVLELARGAGIPAVEGPTAGPDLLTADELFLTGTAAEVIGIVKIDGQAVGSGREGSITRRMRELYREAVRRPG